MPEVSRFSVRNAFYARPIGVYLYMGEQHRYSLVKRDATNPIGIVGNQNKSIRKPETTAPLSERLLSL
jgi:hypothetical protein